MNFGTKLRTILAIATSLNTALMATDLTGFNNFKLDIIYKVVSIILNFVIVACVTKVATASNWRTYASYMQGE